MVPDGLLRAVIGEAAPEDVAQILVARVGAIAHDHVTECNNCTADAAWESLFASLDNVIAESKEILRPWYDDQVAKTGFANSVQADIEQL